MTRRINEHLPSTDQIGLSDNGSDAEGWPYVLLLGLDLDKGWMFECSMDEGKLSAAFTPAGVDPLFLMGASETPEGATTATITVETGSAVWDEATKTLTITNG